MNLMIHLVDTVFGSSLERIVVSLRQAPTLRDIVAFDFGSQHSNLVLQRLDLGPKTLDLLLALGNLDDKVFLVLFLFLFVLSSLFLQQLDFLLGVD